MGDLLWLELVAEIILEARGEWAPALSDALKREPAYFEARKAWLAKRPEAEVKALIQAALEQVRQNDAEI
jgi:hypothetical protein